MGETLKKIVAELRRLGRTSTLALLQPGLAEPQIVAELTQLRLDPPPDLVKAYEWHDETDVTTGAKLDDLHLFPGFYFLSLEGAIANYTTFMSDDRWDPAWFPMFTNGGGDFFAAVCDREHRDFGRVIHFRIEQSHHPVEFASVKGLLATVAAAYEDGVYFVDDRGYLEMDDRAFIALASRMNK